MAFELSINLIARFCKMRICFISKHLFLPQAEIPYSVYDRNKKLMVSLILLGRIFFTLDNAKTALDALFLTDLKTYCSMYILPLCVLLYVYATSLCTALCICYLSLYCSMYM